MTAISDGFVVCVISIKRLSIVFSVILGYLIFREKNINHRIIGAIIMLIGTAFIVLQQNIPDLNMILSLFSQNIFLDKIIIFITKIFLQMKYG